MQIAGALPFILVELFSFVRKLCFLSENTSCTKGGVKAEVHAGRSQWERTVGATALVWPAPGSQDCPP